jgi:hypothetical protein
LTPATSQGSAAASTVTILPNALLPITPPIQARTGSKTKARIATDAMSTGSTSVRSRTSIAIPFLNESRHSTGRSARSPCRMILIEASGCFRITVLIMREVGFTLSRNGSSPSSWLITYLLKKEPNG